MNTQEKREELKKHLKERGLTQEAIAEMFGVSQANIGALLNGKTPFGKQVAISWEDRLGVRAAWLLIGDGDMLKGKSVQKIGSISGEVNGVVGNVHGDYHSNGGKDRAIIEQEKNVQYSLDVLTSELQRFHEQLERKDVYIRELIYNNDLRHSEKDRRIEDLTTELIKITDKVIDLLNKKL